MIRRLLLTLLVLFAVDVALLILLGKATNGWVVAGVIAGTAFLGVAVLGKRLGALRRLRQGAGGMTPPATNLLESATLSIAGILLIAPGPIADVCGILLLVPWTRRRVRQGALAWFAYRTRRQLEQFAAAMQAQMPPGAPPRQPGPGPTVIDAEFTKETIDPGDRDQRIP